MLTKFKLFESLEEDPKGNYSIGDRVICKCDPYATVYGVNYNNAEGTIISFFKDGSNVELLVKFDNYIKGLGNGDNGEDPEGMSAYVKYDDAELIPTVPARIRWYRKGRLEEGIRWYKGGKLLPMEDEKDECDHKYELKNYVAISSTGHKVMKNIIVCSLCGKKSEFKKWATQ